MAKKESRPAWFKLFRHQKALIDSVPDESAGKAIKAVFQYFENGEVPPLSPLEFAVFSSIKPYVDESFEDFAETSRKNRENVQKRWGKESCTSGNQSLPVVPVVLQLAKEPPPAPRPGASAIRWCCLLRSAAALPGTPSDPQVDSEGLHKALQ